VCIDTNVDGNNCGSCGTSCGPGFVCAQAACAGTCPTSLMQCGQSCFDTQIDHDHCGACGTACGQFQLCCGGTCVDAGTADHCGSCAPCPNVGDFCSFEGPGMRAEEG